MENETHSNSYPKVGQDDFLEMMTITTENAWLELAHEQPELAREIEQQASNLRLLIELNKTNPLEVQKIAIDIAVFAVETLIHAQKRAQQSRPALSKNIPPQVI